MTLSAAVCLPEVRCPSCSRLLARMVLGAGTGNDTHHYELRRRGKPVAVVTSGELHCVCGKSVKVGGIGHEQQAMHK